MHKELKEIADFIAACASDLAADILEGATPEELGCMSNYGHWHATLLQVSARLAGQDARIKELEDLIPKIQEMAYGRGYIVGQGYKS